jgi:6-phosphofructokinase 1
LASQTDLSEAYLAGKVAVEAAVSGISDKMVAFDCIRNENGYECYMKLLNLTEVANIEKKVPRTWINERGNGVSQEFINYVLPLINGEVSRPLEHGLPRFAKLKKQLVR